MSSTYPVDKMDLPELELLFAVLTGIRIKYRSQNNQFIMLGMWPKFENVSHNDLIHIVGRLSDAGFIKRHTGISMLLGLSISVTDAFEPFYEWVQSAIELQKIEAEEPEVSMEIKEMSFDQNSCTISINGFNIIITDKKEECLEKEVMTYIFNHKDEDEHFYYAEIAKENNRNYDTKNKYAHQQYSSACKRINTKINNETQGQISNFLVPNFKKNGFVYLGQEHLI